MSQAASGRHVTTHPRPVPREEERGGNTGEHVHSPGPGHTPLSDAPGHVQLSTHTQLPKTHILGAPTNNPKLPKHGS